MTSGGLDRQASKVSKTSQVEFQRQRSKPDKLVDFLEKIKDLAFLKQPLFKGNTVLHFLSQAPLDEAQMRLVAHFLQMGVKPGQKNESDDMTFLNLSPIKSRLCQMIEQAEADWFLGIFDSWKDDSEMLQRWSPRVESDKC